MRKRFGLLSLVGSSIIFGALSDSEEAEVASLVAEECARVVEGLLPKLDGFCATTPIPPPPAIGNLSALALVLWVNLRVVLGSFVDEDAAADIGPSLLDNRPAGRLKPFTALEVPRERIAGIVASVTVKVANTKAQQQTTENTDDE
mmetsp:Transcript_27103/g.47927  ORF Transcript_27103/g.47927 Transcript_27103/m.47927 type:complete len:146 (-) Transcript_27103:77-514(-)